MMLRGNRRLVSIIAGLITLGAVVLVPGTNVINVSPESQTNAITAIVAIVGATQAFIKEEENPTTNGV